MNHSLPLLFACTLLFGASRLAAQFPEDTLYLGQGYSNQVYFEIADGDQHTMPLAGWDIAFETAGFGAGIITNGGKNVNLYIVPGKKPADFGKPVDTTGIGAWEHPANSLASWSNGAFNVGASGDPADFGWGEYSISTHFITGTKLYVITTPDGGARQIAIDQLVGGTYSFRTAMLDGSDSASHDISKGEHANHHFAYYSITGNNSFDNEPEMDEWDIVFTKYMDVVGGMPYVVTGVLSAPGVTVAQVTSATPATAPAPTDTALYSDSLNMIGYDWKTFTGSAYTVRQDQVFFVHAKDDNIYRLIMTGFVGSSTGQITFRREQVNTVSVDDRAGRAVGSMAVAPNVVRGGENASLVLDLKRENTVRVSVVDASGRVVATQTVNGRTGLQAIALDSRLEAGSYMVAVEIDGVVKASRLIVQ